MVNSRSNVSPIGTLLGYKRQIVPLGPYSSFGILSLEDRPKTVIIVSQIPRPSYADVIIYFYQNSMHVFQLWFICTYKLLLQILF